MANNISVLDSTGAAQVVKSTDTASVHTPHHNVDAVIPGTGATNLGKAEDGDYAPLEVTQNGALLVCNAANDDYKYAIIDAATSGDNTLVAGVTSRKIRVLSAFLMSSGTVTARFESGASGTALTGQVQLIAQTGFVLPFNPAGWFETAAGVLLNLELSGAVSVDGSLTYIEVP
jgi:hypothetical protein